jgi:hypothetical protein
MVVLRYEERLELFNSSTVGALTKLKSEAIHNLAALTTALFQRVLPQNRFDRLLNFVKFDMVEPLWPVHLDETRMAEKTT